MRLSDLTRKHVVAVDFDGTVVKHRYPHIGPPVPFALTAMKLLVEADVGLVLWTMRHDRHLTAAVDYFRYAGVPLYGVQTNPSQSSWTGSPKAYADVYIDDSAAGCPLTHEDPRPYVDWPEMMKDYRIERMINGTRDVDIQSKYTCLINYTNEEQE